MTLPKEKVYTSYWNSIQFILTCFLIFLFAWNYSPYATFWILYVSLITRDQMHMDMEYRLAGSFIDVDSDIISVGVITLVHLLLHVLEHHIHCFTLMIGQIEIGGDMTLGNYQSMAG